MKIQLTNKGKIGSMSTKNRIVMAAVPAGLIEADGTPAAGMPEFYRVRAGGNAGVIITEAVYVGTARKDASLARQLSLNRSSRTEGLAGLAAAVHQHGSKLLVRLWQPSLAPAEIEKLAADYIEAGIIARSAGCDGLELDGTPGSLMYDFLSPRSNLRQDRYGGSLANRMNLVRDIIDGIRKATGEAYPVILRLDREELETISTAQGAALGTALAAAGLDAVTVACPGDEYITTGDALLITLLKNLKESSALPVIPLYQNPAPELAEHLLQAGAADFVGLSRGFLADENWGTKACGLSDLAIRKCIECLDCVNAVEAGEGVKCNVNPRAGLETVYQELQQNGAGRVVAIAGAGPAGLAAAETLKLRGFQPVVLEQKDEIGGQTAIGKYVPVKENLYRVTEYYERNLDKIGIELRLNCEATPELIKELNPVAVFVASGAVPIVPADVPGTDLGHVYSVEDIMRQRANPVRQRVVVIGAGLTGLGLAEQLAAAENIVTVVDMQQPEGAEERLY
jgi:2,4-dienoyl-CoA reductase-like NADH-dependent reductase (Old Yellow Enzyme family)